jgi:5'(3')-deoxyribonucleotidase
MRILLDVDGVVADWSTALLQAVGSDLTLADVTDWNIFGLLTKQQAAAAKALCGTRAFWQELPVMRGAQEVVERLRDRHQLLWVTSPWWSCDGWMQARLGWLRRHFGVLPDHVIFCSCKWAISGHVLIDDKPDNVTSWGEHNVGFPVLFDAPYNRSVDHDLRANWSNLTQIVDALEPITRR